MRLRLIFGLAVAGLASWCHAWDDQGHTVIGIVAYNQLDAAAKAKLVKILNAGEPSYAIDPTAEALTVGRTATWADYIKKATDSAYEDVITAFNDMTNPPDRRAANDNEGVRCKVWHYINVIVHAEGRLNTFKPQAFDAVQAVNLARERFPKESTDKMRAWWVYWLMHVVGDLHQPLHCCASIAQFPNGDAGGNRFQLSGDVKNLHWLWDNGIRDGINQPGWSGTLVDRAAKLEESYPKSLFSAKVPVLDPAKWAQDGAQKAVDFVYTGIRPNETPSKAYLDQRNSLSLSQAALGGYRLGAILQQLLKD